MRGWMKGALGAGIVVVVAAAGAAALVDRALDQDRLRRAVIVSIERQSGRTVTLQALRVQLLPSPRLEARGFTLANPDGDPDPVMLRLGDVQARLGLWPLLRHVVRLDGLRIADASLSLERDADGRANWQMGPRRRAGGNGASTGHAEPWGVSFGSVQLRDASLSLQDRRAHRSGAVRITRMDGEGLQGERPSIDLAGTHGGAGFTVAGSIGPVGRLFDATDRRSPWPVSLQLAEQVSDRVLAQASLDGALADPHDGRGYDLQVRYSIARLAALNRLFPHARLPMVQGLSGSLHVVDAGHPVLTALAAQAGASVLRGVTLSSWRLDAPDGTAPLAIDARGSWQGRMLRLHGTAGTLGTLQTLRAAGLSQAATPVNLQLESGGAALRAEGQLGGGGGDLRLDAAVPDLPALLPGAPGVGPLALAARLQLEGGRLFRLSHLSLTSGAGDLAGDLALVLQRRPSLTGTLTSTRLDADRLGRWSRSARPAVASAPPTVKSTAGPTAAPTAAPTALATGGAVPAQAPVPAAAPAPTDRIAPWAVLRQADLDLSLQVADLLVAGQTLHNLVAHAVLKDGRLLVDPVQGTGAAGPVSARLSADASATPPNLEVTMHPLFLPASVLAGWLGQPNAMQGAAELVGMVTAQGATAPALAASASGHLGLSLVNGSVSDETLLRLLGHSAPLSLALPRGGTTPVSCLALHATIGGGEAHLDTIALRTGRASVDGHGEVGLANGALDLHLLPFVSLGAAGASMPVRIGGSVAQPRPALDSEATGGRTTLVIGPQDAAVAGCGAALRAAREGVAGPDAVADAPGRRHKTPKPLDFLRGLGLFR